MFRRTVSAPILGFAALYTLAGGYVHLDQWWNGYRAIPASVPGSWVVRVGFPANAAAAALVAIALVVALRRRSLAVPALLAAMGLSGATLALLVATRLGTVFGWSEPAWTPGAEQARAVAVGALLVTALGVVGSRAALGSLDHTRRPRKTARA